MCEPSVMGRIDPMCDYASEKISPCKVRHSYYFFMPCFGLYSLFWSCCNTKRVSDQVLADL